MARVSRLTVDNTNSGEILVTSGYGRSVPRPPTPRVVFDLLCFSPSSDFMLFDSDKMYLRNWL